MTHEEVRHDLLLLNQDPNYPTWLTDDYLDMITSGHKKEGSAAFKDSRRGVR